MASIPTGAVAVIFVSSRNARDSAGYAAAADAMMAEAARQPGYLGVDSVRDADGIGITVSYWADHASAEAWRDHAGHAAIRAQRRADWYDSYRLLVCDVARGYEWMR